MTIQEIYTFIKEELWEMPIERESDILTTFRIEGEDCFLFIEAFAKTFDVDISTYQWYFHHKDANRGVGTIFLKTLDEKVDRIEITPEILLQSAVQQSWVIRYPVIVRKGIRYELIFSDILFVIFGSVACLLSVFITNYWLLGMGGVFTLVGLLGLYRYYRSYPLTT